MNYELIFYLLVAFFLGRWSKLNMYIGSDKHKYKEADFGILLIKKGE